ncbi:hypothetical protein ACFLXJ_04305 [Chloroflexota bacterium]
MPRCPNCGQKTARTEDWACQWCGYPLLSESYKKVTKTYKELQEENCPEPKMSVMELESEPELEPEPEPVAEVEAVTEPEPAPEPVAEVEPVTEPELTPEPVAEVEPVTEPEPAPEPVAEAEPVTEPEPAPNLEPEPTSGVIVTTVDQLNSAFTADKAAANTKLTGKNLKITGVVDKTVVKEHIDILYALLTGTGKQGQWSVRCTFDNKYSAQLKRVTTGETVTVQGAYAGYERNIILKDCTLAG